MNKLTMDKWCSAWIGWRGRTGGMGGGLERRRERCSVLSDHKRGVEGEEKNRGSEVHSWDLASQISQQRKRL